ncbi:sulfite exporter TauE/SafE family protein [Helicobacter magdeburgensis]|uniref:Sulfite exporter TauE/SafE family protein n=1 Tax=Helicobacter magdeburgensis TaxID=471858 RepID=A0A4U8T4R5_9HELI|nr:sulfite exporter TauE/SafE family protein [Helicobacter magdeburgensis]TLD93527.1 sulfite exporter TauE/SafE family protein [Helicobacter magdeburgensis]
MEHIEIATLLSIAFFASLGHCVGMCGGIVVAYTSLYQAHKTHRNAKTHSLESSKDSLNATTQTQGQNLQDSKFSSLFTQFFTQIPLHLSYHTGKITTYATLGFIAGSLGHFLSLNEQIKAVILLIVGILLVLFGLSSFNFARLNALFSSLTPKPLQKLISLTRPFLLKPSLWRIYILGLLNGLLPCGIVYYFLLTATIAGNGLNGAIVMILFGVTTIPPLFTLGILSTALQNKRLLFLRIGAVGMIIFGCYEVYKSLGYLI